MKYLYKTSLFLLIWIVSALWVDAAPISFQQALQNAQMFLKNKGRVEVAPTLSLVTSKSLHASSEKYYVFNIGSNEGYVIAAGDDCAPAILGYADEGYINVDSMPVNLQSWLEEYAQQIQFMQENGFASLKAPKLTSNYAVIPPLMTTTWDQQDPYNQNCPDFFSYGKCVTGCVATAMAQVMYYHRANSVAQTTAQIPAYDCRTMWLNGSDTLGHIHVDAIPAGSPIDWNNMLDSYSGSTTATQKQAVANLMKYCGASVRMNYANAWSGGSGAYSSDVPIALKSYFNYSDETTLQYRSNYSSDAAWESLVYTELSSSRPVYYSGRNSSGGHAFVCDGYDGSGYYHINWGWSGTSDGYFLLTALDPDQQGTGGSSSGYNQNQAALINAQPKSSSPSNPVLATSISLNNTSAEINTGETLQLTATVLPSNATNKTVTWTTSNSSVATVSSTGLVTAKAVGNATITARTTDGSNLSASCSVTVKQSSVLATSISLSKTSAEINTGGTLQLTATVLPSNATNKVVTWSSSNPTIASVDDNGLVTALAAGFVTITAMTTDGSNLSASCNVTVTENLSNYDNYLSMSDVDAFRGDTIVIPVKMTNEASIISFQTDIFLPEGIELLQEDGEYLIDPSERMTRTHSIMSNKVSNGAIRVLCYSSNYKPFTGNSGDDLFYLTVKVADDAEGDYTIQLKNTLLTNTDFVDLAAPDVSANVNVKAYLLGDANNSGTVSITDVVVTAQYVLELNPQPFIFEAADVNVDGNITVTDVTRIAWIVLNPTLNAPRQAPALWDNGDHMSGEGINLAAGETQTVSIALDNDRDYSAFQLDLSLPEGLMVSNFRLTDRAGSHAFDVNALQNGSIRALCYSPVMTCINGHQGALLTFDVTATGTVNGDITVDGIELVTPNCKSVQLDGFTIVVNNATGVNETSIVKTVARMEYYNLAGQRLDRPESGVILVVTSYTDGTRVTSRLIKR